MFVMGCRNLNALGARWQRRGVRAKRNPRSFMSSDAELIGRSLRGDTDAFVEVISRHETALGNYLARRVGRQAAEDVLGDVLVAAYEYRENYDRLYTDARTWLYCVTLYRL